MGERVQDLTAASSLALTDLIYALVDPSGTPLDRKATLQTLKTALGAGVSAITFQARLTLASGYAVYRPQRLTPSSTDTTAETTTFAVVHGWVTGTIVSLITSVGGLTAGTLYYINAQSSTSVSYHTTLANAIAGTSKVNLTANITSAIIPSGIQGTTLYLTPYQGNGISLYDGSSWVLSSITERSIALGTLTSGRPYDVFVYNNSGTITLELVAWTSDTVRATDLALQDGVYVKAGTLTKRYCGTIRTDSTTTTIDDAGGLATQVGGKRFVWNAYNRKPAALKVIDTSAGWSYNTATVRQANAAAGNKVEFVLGLPEEEVSASIYSSLTASNNPNLAGTVGVGVDTTAAYEGMRNSGPVTAFSRASISCQWRRALAMGYHFLAWCEFGNANTGTLGWLQSTLAETATGENSGLIGQVYC